MSEFHPLAVASVEALTDDAVAVTFAVPDELVDAFAFLPGQHVLVRATVDGRDVRRSYSICADPATGMLRVGIKRIPGGRFSTYATERLRPGDVLDVAPPVGEFVVRPDPSRSRHLGAVVAGSGITPVLSIVSAVLRAEPESRVTLILGNRESRAVMFLEELAGLKDRYPDRFHLVHVLSREPSLFPLYTGRIDAAKLEELLDTVVDGEAVDEWFLCGPYEMVQDARKVLQARGWPTDRVHDELFFSGPAPAPPPAPDDDEEAVTVTFVLDGRASMVKVDPEGPPILDYALAVRPDAPYSCRGGMCTTCKARLVSGDVRLDRNFALTEEELDRGYVLTCQAHPTSDEVELTYDV